MGGPVPPPKPRSGLIALADGMRAYFAQQKVPAVVTPVGWKYRSFVLNQGPGGGSRVCLIPGKIDPSAGTPPKVSEAGRFSQPHFGDAGSGGGYANPRRLANWERVVTLSVWAVDARDLRNDELQFAALEDLVEATYQAMHNAVDPVTGINVGLADVVLEDAVWVLPPAEIAFGRELVAYFRHFGPLFDAGDNVVTPKPAIARNPAT